MSHLVTPPNYFPFFFSHNIPTAIYQPNHPVHVPFSRVPCCRYIVSAQRKPLPTVRWVCSEDWLSGSVEFMAGGVECQLYIWSPGNLLLGWRGLLSFEATPYKRRAVPCCWQSRRYIVVCRPDDPPGSFWVSVLVAKDRMEWS